MKRTVTLLIKSRIDIRKLPYLEKVCKTNLSKLSFIMKDIRTYARLNNFKSSWTAYYLWGTKGKKIPLRFSKSGTSDIEEAYATHFVVTSNGTMTEVNKN